LPVARISGIGELDSDAKPKHDMTDVILVTGSRGGMKVGPTSATDKDTTKAVQQACIERNLLLLTCGSYENVIRWIPPLVVNTQQIDEALTVFEDALQAVLA
jgi:4-aminobutyrate aminotransferase-like enzyme